MLAATAQLLNQSPQQMEEHFEKRNPPRGTVEQVRDRLGTMEEAGVQRFCVQSLAGPSVDDFAETFDLIGA